MMGSNRIYGDILGYLGVSDSGVWHNTRRKKSSVTRFHQLIYSGKREPKNYGQIHHAING